MPNKISLNPLYGCEVGTCIKSTSKGPRFQAALIGLDQKITTMYQDKIVLTSMSGESAYVYTDQMNQGEFGVSGSYGASGISKFSAGIGGYVGNFEAKSSKTVNIDYNIKLIAGNECIVFDNLSTIDLINAFQSGPKEALISSLEKFILLKEKINKSVDINDSAIDIDVKNWYDSVQDFFSSYGDGIIVSVIWGGLGTVSLQVTNDSNQTAWKYGMSSELAYSGTGASISIKSAFSGNKNEQTSTVRVKTSTHAFGTCVAGQVAEWGKIVEGKAFSDVCNIALLDKAPNLSEFKNIPMAPAFVKPEKNDQVSQIASKLKDVDGLKDFATKSAFEKSKADNHTVNSNDSFNEFIKKSEDKANSENVIAETQTKIANNDIGVLENISNNFQYNNCIDGNTKLSVSKKAEKTMSQSRANKPEDYTPLGVWIVNWGDLFPWLATGILNEIPENNEEAKNLLKLQCMQQDMIALSRIYYMFGGSSLKSSEVKIDDFIQLGDSFQHALMILQSEMENNDALQTISKAYFELSPSARKIYTFWDNNPVFRNAELGFAISYENQSDSKQYSVTSQPHSSNNTGSGDYVTISFKCGLCNRKGEKNNVLFKSFIRTIPLITPEGNVYMFGPGGMLLKAIDSNKAAFIKKFNSSLKFSMDNQRGLLTNNKANVVLYPISLEDAKDNWPGQIINTSIASNKPLQEQFNGLKDDLENAKVYTFNSETWWGKTVKDWTPEKPFISAKIKAQYYGIVPELIKKFKG